MPIIRIKPHKTARMNQKGLWALRMSAHYEGIKKQTGVSEEAPAFLPAQSMD
jgi:hypothetical protein